MPPVLVRSDAKLVRGLLKVSNSIALDLPRRGVYERKPWPLTLVVASHVNQFYKKVDGIINGTEGMRALRWMNYHSLELIRYSKLKRTSANDRVAVAMAAEWASETQKLIRDLCNRYMAN